MERCQLLENGKKLAAERGLDVSMVVCPIIDICDGSGCVYIAPESITIDDVMTQEQKFYDRLQRTLNIVKNYASLAE